MVVSCPDLSFAIDAQVLINEQTCRSRHVNHAGYVIRFHSVLMYYLFEDSILLRIYVAEGLLDSKY